MADSGKNKVLKTLVIKDGKVVEERLIKVGQSVTVGSASSSTFVLQDDALPQGDFVLFKATSAGYQLRFTAEMKGKLSVGGFKGSLKKLRKDPSVKRDGDIYAVTLGEDDKGSVNIGDGAVWFKFEAPPAPPPTQAVRSLEQMDFRPQLFQDDDPVFLGWLAIWSALGSVLLIWVWNAVPREVELEQLPDRFTRMVIEEDPPEVDEVEDVDEDLEGESAVRKKEEKAEKAKAEPKSKVEKAKAQEEARKEVLQNSKLLIGLIGTTGETDGGVVENMWGDGDEGLGELDGVLGEVSGATTDADPALRAGRGGKGERAGIDELGGVETGNSEVGSGPAVEAKPTVSLGGSGTMDEDIGDQSSARSVVKKNYGSLRYCYEKELRASSTLEGRVEIGWSVYGGKVEGVYVIANSTGSNALADCIVKKVERWEFDAAVEGDMSWPFVFRTE